MIALQSELVHSAAKLKTPGEEDWGTQVVKRGRQGCRGEGQSSGGRGEKTEGGRGRSYDDRERGGGGGEREDKGVNGMLIGEREELRRKFKEKHRHSAKEREESRKGIWAIYMNISDQTEKPKQQKTRENSSLI